MMHPLIDQEKQKLAKKYQREHLKVSIVSCIVSGIFLLVLLYFNISKNFVAVLDSFTTSRLLIAFIYFFVLFFIYTIISFPFSFINSYIIERRYNFSTQNFHSWFIDEIKSFFVGFILGLIVFEVIYIITKVSPSLWWLWLSMIMIIFSVVLANLFPVLILPLFYKTTPIENENLKNRIMEMCKNTGINLKGVFSINLSSKSTKANAAVVGLGNTKRILLGDTLINKYTEDEIISTLAHEITHYRQHHIWCLIYWQSLITLLSFFIFYKIFPYIYNWAGFKQISDISAFPLFAIIFAIISIVFRPISSSISRYYERKADQGALVLTKNPQAFVSLMAKFCNDQLIIAYPNPLLEWYNYSHPAPGKRIKFAETWLLQIFQKSD